MQNYKYIPMFLIITIVCIVCFVFGSRISSSDKKINKTEISLLEERIPKLEYGVNVHELENQIFEVLGLENVAIHTERSSGSGILWEHDGRKITVVTTKHFMQDFEDGEMELWTGEKISFDKTHVTTTDTADIAVINLHYKEKIKQGKSKIDPYVEERSPELGESMWIIDSVYGAASGISSAMIASADIFLEDYGMEMHLLYGEGKAGMSGSPVYNEGGNLVAMMSGMDADGTTLVAVPIKEIVKFLESLEE